MTSIETTGAIVAASGIIASVLIEALNRLTPNHKFAPQTLQAIALTLAAACVIGLSVYRGGLAAVDTAVVLQVLAAWTVALGVHDVASPRT